ncbi:serine protease [Cellvibrio sp. NN19]|uniref:S1 family peptidase n=1 Tax=Cellvibrio chitinivorans TaxID=3102792 RepID=UPI002B40C830|nr:serine protease [Cellvibrio sp. NN19]
MRFPYRLLTRALALAISISLPALADTTPPLPSSAAQQLYASAQQDLLQLRVLLKNGNSQSSVGSGFLIGNSNLVVTNFHVVSQIALEPETYFGEYKDTSGKSGSIELLAVDVLHDLAIVRIERNGSGFFKIPHTKAPHTPASDEQPALVKLHQGQHLYSLGNPLDLGFTISEGTYNGISARGFSDQLMFTGPVNAGMSGGPNVTADGQVAGVNVAHRRDGELVSFLVPVRYVQALLARVTSDMKAPSDFKPIIGEQLLEHQTVMVDTLLDKPFSIKSLGPYRVPVRESDQVRCWGNTDSSAKKPYTIASINCSMESAIFVSGELQTGHLSMHHKYAHNKKLNAMQFAQLATNMFSGQVYSTAKSDTITPASCTEDFIKHNNISLRAMVCAEAYHQFKELYDFTLIAASTDDSQKSLQSMINIQGVSYQNGMKLVEQFLQGIDRASSTDNSEPIIDDSIDTIEDAPQDSSIQQDSSISQEDVQ